MSPAFDPIEEFCYASLEPCKNGRVPGVAKPVSAEELELLDFREQGYERVDVTRQVQPCPGYSLDGQVFTYIDPGSAQKKHPPVNTAYFNMALTGARGWDTVAPGFLEAYCTSGKVPPGGLTEMRFLWIGEDGQTVWLLDEKTGLHTLLMCLPSPLFPAKRPKELTLHWKNLPPAHFLHYDARYPDNTKTNVSQEHSILELMRQARTNGIHAKALAEHACWLVRLASLCNSSAGPSVAHGLRQDTDPWVRHVAMALQSSKQGTS